MKKKLKEETATGTGGSFDAGSGEQFMSNAWVGGRKKKKKIKESVSYTPEKRDEFYKEVQTKLKEYKGNLDKYMNIVAGLSLEDIVKDEARIKKLIKAGETMSDKFNDIYNKLENFGFDYSDEDDKSKSDEFDVLAGDYRIMYNDAYDTHELVQDIEYKVDDFRTDKQSLIAKLFK